jgi:hypothetical protein
LNLAYQGKENMFIVDSFLNGVTKEYGNHPVSTGDVTWYLSQACNFMKLKYHEFCL